MSVDNTIIFMGDPIGAFSENEHQQQHKLLLNQCHCEDTETPRVDQFPVQTIIPFWHHGPHLPLRLSP